MFTGREFSNLFGFYEWSEMGIRDIDGQVREGGGRTERERMSQYRARAYNPLLGRFMTEDPKLFVRDGSLGASPTDWKFAEHPDEAEFNLFRYCDNDPIDFTDPMGLDTELELKYVPISGAFGRVHEYILATDTVTHEALVSQAGPSESWRRSITDVFSDRTQKAIVNPPNANGNTWLKADITNVSQSGVETKDAKGVSGSKVVLKDGLDSVKGKLQEYNDAVNAKKLDYQLKSVNSNSFANSEYNYITGKIAPLPPASAPGATTNINHMFELPQIEPK